MLGGRHVLWVPFMYIVRIAAIFNMVVFHPWGVSRALNPLFLLPTLLVSGRAAATSSVGQTDLSQEPGMRIRLRGSIVDCPIGKFWKITMGALASVRP
ncbi:hypothetical protein F4779DRAFT_241338 [Xylariaceae sp. FL0662B]|nr:hypothetical protein F4779DRAFT_241338 [Xylariaceae sp. FL0662B]